VMHRMRACSFPTRHKTDGQGEREMSQIHRLERVENARPRPEATDCLSIKVVAKPFARRGVNLGRTSLAPANASGGD
jgi:hypothetical protein